MTLPNNAEAGKGVSVTVSSHQIRPERKERATKSLFLERSDISHKRQRPDGIVWSIQPRRTSLFEIMQTRIGKQYAYMLGAYVTRSTFSISFRRSQISTSYSNSSSSNLATYGHLLDQASCRQSDQFSSSCQEKGLVSYSYSNAAEFPIAITNRLREQQGVTQIPGSSRATYGYRANNSTAIQYWLFLL